ncbi:hypothetical protein [Bacteroides clarus]|jgi:hypothetical protein|uniref:hypothetical protein n=1 Tax=Bacteroides clarus TaxID=626929 RepID=UPI00248E2C47|nr:hypothetical protein [Bacteroides clarus]
MKTYKPMRTPQGYSYQLNAINTGLENIDDEIREFIGKGDINQIDFKQNIIPSFVRKKMSGYFLSCPDFRVSMLLSGVHFLSLDFNVYRKELSFLINNEMKKGVPDLFVMKMLEGMKKYRQLYKEKEKQCSLLPELIAYYQTGNNPYWILSDGKASPRWDGVTGYFRSLDYSCKALLEIADYYRCNNKQTTYPTKQTKLLSIQKSDFRNIIQYEDKEKLLNRLHFLIDGKRGADVGAILLQAKVEGYLMRTPNRAEFENEFGKLTDDENSTAKSKWEAIRKYLDSENSTAINKCSSMNIRIFEP